MENLNFTISSSPFNPRRDVRGRPENVQQLFFSFFCTQNTNYLSVLENAHTACTRHIYMYNIYICIWCIILHFFLERVVI